MFINDIGDAKNMDDAENMDNPSCLFCPDSMKDEVEDLRVMPASYLRSHIAFCHVDMKKNPNEPTPSYVCDGNGIKGDLSLCTPEQRVESVAVNTFVDHLEEEHPDQPISHQLRYKAALSDLMAELCIYGSFDESLPGSAFFDFRRQMLSSLLVSSEASTESKDQGAVASASFSESEDPSMETVTSSGIVEEDDSFGEEVERETIPTSESPPSVSTTSSAAATPPGFAVAVAAQEEVGPTPRLPISRRGIKKNIIYSSKEYREFAKKLNVRYGLRNGGRGRQTIPCLKCGQKLAYNGAASAINHALTHMEGCAIQCRLCDYEGKTNAAWAMHFSYHHQQTKGEVTEGRASYSDFYIDKRKELEQEIVKFLKKCFEA